MADICKRCRRRPYALKTYRIDAFGKHYIFHLPEDTLYERLMAFEWEHFGKVEFEIFGEIAEEGIDYWIMIHTKEGIL